MRRQGVTAGNLAGRLIMGGGAPDDFEDRFFHPGQRPLRTYARPEVQVEASNRQAEQPGRPEYPSQDPPEPKPMAALNIDRERLLSPTKVGCF
jgi:hypothetical protein